MVDLLRCKAASLIDRSLEESSHERYTTAVKHIMRFMPKVNGIKICINEELLVLYASWRFTFSKVIWKTVDTKLSGIISYLNRYGYCKLERRNMFRLRCLMMGYKKLRPSKDPKLAITDEVLKRWIDILDMNDVNQANLATALIFKKCMTLRNSEGWKWNHESKGVLLRDIRFSRNNGKYDGIVFGFDKSKTNQFGLHEYAAARCLCRQGKLCAVHAVLDLLRLKKKRGYKVGLDVGIFIKTNGKVLSYEEIGKEIKKLCTLSGMDGTLYAPHGLRKGGATDYIAWGVPVEIVKDMGRCKLMESMDVYRKLSASAMINLTTKQMAALCL